MSCISPSAESTEAAFLARLRQVSREETFRAAHSLLGSAAVSRIRLLARIVKVVFRSFKYDRFQLATRALRTARERFTYFWRYFIVRRGNHHEQRGIGMVASFDRIHSAAGIFGNRRAKSSFRRGLLNPGRVADCDQNGHAAVRPALHADSIADHIASSTQIAQRPIGIERPHSLFAHLARPIFVTASRKAQRISARTKAIHQERNVSPFGPELAPLVVPLRKRRCIVHTLGE